MASRRAGGVIGGITGNSFFKKADHGVRRIRRSVKAWALRRKRARAGRKKSMKNRRMLIVLSLTLVGLFVAYAVAADYLTPEPPGRHLSIDQLSALADQGRLETAKFLDEDSILVGSYAPPARETDPESTDESNKDAKKDGAKNDGASKAETEDPEGSATDTTAPAEEEDQSLLPADTSRAPSDSGKYYVEYLSTDAISAILAEMVTDAGAVVSIDGQGSKQVVRLVTTFLLPLMILANLFALLFLAGKGGGSGIGEVMTFGSIGKRRYRKGRATAPVTFSQVAGADEAVAELKEVVDYLREPERYEDIGATPPKGVLLFGPPGCGKTLLAKAVAGEAGVPFFSVAGAEFVESLVGVGAARVRDLFARVRAVAPAIVFIDELDAAGRKRGTGGGGGGSDEREQTLNQMLVEMDGFEVSSGIVVMGATNRPDILDPALLRPGRFDRHITVDQPDIVGRQQILELHANGKPVSPTVDFTYLSRRCPGFSGADLANVINEAALLTLRENKEEIEITEFEEAIQRVLAGPKKKGRVLSPEERKRAAFHESGHALVAAASGRLDQVHRVSILARGRGIGQASIQQGTDAVLLTRSQLLGDLVTAMGGLASEVLVFGEPSTGAEKDLEEATDLARDIVGRFGMGKRRRRLLAKEAEAFLGDDAPLAQISAQTHHEMEEEIDRLIEDAEHEATRLLETHRPILDTLATRLETEETLEGTDLETIVALVRPEVTLFGGLLDDPPPVQNGHAEVKNSSGSI